jgi:tetratricopeptide (TPR) repeat protein
MTMASTYDQLDPVYKDSLNRSLRGSASLDVELVHRLLEVDVTDESTHVFELALERLVQHAQGRLALRVARKLARWAKHNDNADMYLMAKFALACILMCSGQYDSALKEFYRVLSANTQDRLYFSALASTAQTMMMLGDYKNAYSMLEVAYTRYFREYELTHQSVSAARMLGYLSSRLDYDTASGFYREALTRAHALGRLDLADEISREAGLVAFPVEPTRNPQPATLEDAAQMLQCNLVSMGVETSELIELLTDEKVCALV